METISGLGQYGAVGIILAAVLGLFLWAFKRLFSHVLDQWKDFTKFMGESTIAMSAIKDAIVKAHEDFGDGIKQVREDIANLKGGGRK
jgi:hypothetical protein